MYNEKSNERYLKETQERKIYSVLCGCGHRIYIPAKTIYKVCCVCGKKHISPKEEFKNKIRSLLEKLMD